MSLRHGGGAILRSEPGDDGYYFETAFFELADLDGHEDEEFYIQRWGARAGIPTSWAYPLYDRLCELWCDSLTALNPAIETIQGWLLSEEPLESITLDRVIALPEVTRWREENGFV